MNPPVTAESARRTELRELRLLELVAESPEPLTQRALATRLGVALGLTNLYLKRLVRKGHLKGVNIQANRVRYLITPQGIVEKARLTYAFIDHSLSLYAQARGHLRAALTRLDDHRAARVGIYGTGEAAELIYLTLREHGIEPAAVFSRKGGGTFLGYPVKPIGGEVRTCIDLVVLATLEDPAPLLVELSAMGLPRELLLPLRAERPNAS